MFAFLLQLGVLAGLRTIKTVYTMQIGKIMMNTHVDHHERALIP